MKRIVIMLSLLAIALPISAFAGAVDISNKAGTLTGSTAGLTLTGSELISVDGMWGNPVGNLGTVSFSTGSFINTVGTGLGSVSYFNSGGTFTIAGNGADGVPNGVLFTGTFTNQVTLTLTGMTSNGGDIYTLSGQISGQWSNGATVTGATSQIYLFTGKNGWMGTSTMGSGDTIIGSVPEPGTLGLLGTGLVGLAGIVRKKWKT
jgi:hypothetical protein